MVSRVKLAKAKTGKKSVLRGEVLPPSAAAAYPNLKPYQRGVRAPKQSNAGRPAGKPNRITRIIKEAALLAFEQCGEPSETSTVVIKDGVANTVIKYHWNGADGLVGYIRHVAKHDYKAAMGLLSKILPMQVIATKEPDEDEYESVDDVLDALRKKGYNADMVDHIATQVFAQKVEYRNRKK